MGNVTEALLATIVVLSVCIPAAFAQETGYRPSAAGADGLCSPA